MRSEYSQSRGTKVIELHRRRDRSNTTQVPLRYLNILSKHQEDTIRIHLLQQPNVLCNTLPFRSRHADVLEPFRVADNAKILTNKVELPGDAASNENTPRCEIDIPSPGKLIARVGLEVFPVCRIACRDSHLAKCTAPFDIRL